MFPVNSILLPPEKLAAKLALFNYKEAHVPSEQQRLIDYAINSYYLEVNQSPHIKINVYSRFYTPRLLRELTNDLAMRPTDSFPYLF